METYRLEQSQRLLGEIVREPRYLVADRPEQLVLVAATERRLADEHLVHQHTERPPVDGLIVLLPLRKKTGEAREVL